MAGASTKKRSHADSTTAGKLQRPKKKQKKALQYHSDSGEEEDLDNAVVDDVPSGSDADSDVSDSDADVPARVTKKSVTAGKSSDKRKKPVEDGPDSEGVENDEGNDEDEEEGDDDDEYTNSEGEMSNLGGSQRSKSKRNDPSAFATSLQKIISTKLSNSKRADAILSRSVEAQKASRQIVDATLEAKARKLLRDQKLLALEKGRVRDVMTGDDPEGTSTGEIMQTERRLRKTAHRGVIMLFRAVREAQERATEAENDARKEGIIGVQQRQEKVNEMSRQGFLDLIAAGGGKAKKAAPLEA